MLKVMQQAGVKSKTLVSRLVEKAGDVLGQIPDEDAKAIHAEIEESAAQASELTSAEDALIDAALGGTRRTPRPRGTPGSADGNDGERRQGDTTAGDGVATDTNATRTPKRAAGESEGEGGEPAATPSLDASISGVLDVLARLTSTDPYRPKIPRRRRSSCSSSPA
jgi:hypothetical protein